MIVSFSSIIFSSFDKQSSSSIATTTIRKQIICLRCLRRKLIDKDVPIPRRTNTALSPSFSPQLYIPCSVACIPSCEHLQQLTHSGEFLEAAKRKSGSKNARKKVILHVALPFALMFKAFSKSEDLSGSHRPPNTKSLSQTFNKISCDPYAPTLHQHASQRILEPPDPVSIASTTRYTFTADHPILEPTKSHRHTTTEFTRSISDLPPLISRSPDSIALSASQLSTIPQLKPSSQLGSSQFSPQQSRQSSPTRSNRISVLTGKSEGKTEKLAEWFKGESEPISIGIIPSPTKEKGDPLDSIAHSSDVPVTALRQQQSTAQIMARPVIASRFSFFSSKASLVKPKPLPNDLNDELLELDVSTALFPNEPANPFSPASFKNLQQQAESLLSRLQTAYKERTIALRDMIAEKETIAEESEGAVTRARHLKMQLDDMTAKFAEQDQAMMNLVDELAQEKQARREEEEARKKTIRVVRDITPPSSGSRHPGLSRSNTVSDSGFESEDDSSVDSVFSRRNGAHSPIPSVSSASTASSPDTFLRTHEFPIAATTAQIARRRMGEPAGKGAPVHSCTNCEGPRASSEAWSIVSILKDENEELKHRVGELEGALDGCLDVVGRLS